MEQLASLDRAGERISRIFPADAVCNQVFPGEAERTKFILSLAELHNRGIQIQVGGRAIREQLDCRTIDFSADIVPDVTLLDDHQRIRLSPLLKYLESYPEARMRQPDLDFFFHGGDIQAMQETLSQRGFSTTLNTATGDVSVLTIAGSVGSATFIDREKSWRTTPPWPMLGGLIADFRPQPTPCFQMDKGYGRMYIYPLEPEMMSVRHIDPLNPHWLACVGRSLLWSLTVSTNKGRLPVPLPETQSLMCQTVNSLCPLITDINAYPEKNVLYRGGLRDLAVALRIIVLSDWTEMGRLGTPRETVDFYNSISAAWTSGLFANLGTKFGQMSVIYK